MKKIVLISLSIMIAGSIWVGSASNNEVYAITGCCKQRVTVNEPWYRSGSDLEVCKDLNIKIDKNRDNVFNESGKVWWDLAC